jgi:hypothetical protein
VSASVSALLIIIYPPPASPRDALLVNINFCSMQRQSVSLNSRWYSVSAFAFRTLSLTWSIRYKLKSPTKSILVNSGIPPIGHERRERVNLPDQQLRPYSHQPPSAGTRPVNQICPSAPDSLSIPSQVRNCRQTRHHGPRNNLYPGEHHPSLATAS